MNLTYVQHKLTKKEAEAIVGTLSAPSKMPCFGYSIPASMCVSGAALMDVKDSVCHKCYANKGRYVFPNVQNAMQKRAASLYDPRWVTAMVTLINATNNQYFRWHDSGDLQSLQHLLNIVRVAEQTPSVQHWLPTREYKLIDLYLQTYNSFPNNLTVRVSAHMVDTSAPKRFTNTSSVHKNNAPIGQACVAPLNNNQCGTCRACWDKSVQNVSYHVH